MGPGIAASCIVPAKPRVLASYVPPLAHSRAYLLPTDQEDLSASSGPDGDGSNLPLPLPVPDVDVISPKSFQVNQAVRQSGSQAVRQSGSQAVRQAHEY